MSSETSADESDTDDVTSAYAFKVWKLQWLKKIQKGIQRTE